MYRMNEYSYLLKPCIAIQIRLKEKNLSRLSQEDLQVVDECKPYSIGI